MIQGTFDFTIYQGSTYKQTFLFDDGIDLSNYNIVRMNIRKSPSSDILFDSTATGNETTLTISGNAIILNLPAETTEDFDFDTAGYDIEIVKTASPHEVDKVLGGKITLVREYTRYEYSV